MARLPKTFDGLLSLHVPKAIHDDVGYRNACEMVRALTRVPSLSKGQLEYFETLGVLIESYEKRRYPIDPAEVTPLDCLKALLEANDMNTADLGRLLGVSRSAASLILNGKRGLTTGHISTLCQRFRVGPELFIK